MNTEIQTLDNFTYLVTKTKKDKEVNKLLLTAIIEIIGTGKNIEAWLVKIFFENKEETRILPADIFSSRSKWITWLGVESSWFGTANDLELYKHFLISNAAAEKIIILDSFSGRYKNGKINLIVADNGIYVHPNSDPMPYDNGKKLLNIDTETIYITQGNTLEALRPFHKYRPQNDVDPKDFLELWHNLFGDHVLLNALLGWMLAIFFMPEVIVARGERFFPYFFLQGNTEAGKTALLRVAIKLFGIDYSSNYCETSPFVEFWHLSRVSLIPLWRDEYREKGKWVLQKEAMARSLYAMDQIEKGVSATEIVPYKPLTTWLLSGEGSPRDPAYLRRCIKFILHKNLKVDLVKFKEAETRASTVFPSMLKQLWINGFSEKNFKEIYGEKLITSNYENEEKICYATLAAFFGVEFGQQVLKEANEYWKLASPENSEKDDTVNQFWTEVYQFGLQSNWFSASAYAKPKLLNYFEILKDEIYEKNEIRIKHAPLLEIITERLAWKDKSTMGRVAIKNLILEKYNAEEKITRINDTVTRSIIIDRKNIAEGDSLNEIIVAYSEAQESLESRDQRNINSSHWN